MNNGESQVDQALDQMSNDPQVVVPVDTREMTRIVTDQGEIHVIHEMTLGDLVTSALLIMLLVFLIINAVARRF